MVALIKSFEGFSKVSYLDVAGWPTVGWGHLLKSGQEGISYPQEQLEGWFDEDLFKAERAVTSLVTAPLLQNQFDALVDFAFNLGGGRLQASTLRMKVNRGDHWEAPAEFRKWVYAGGKKVRGLIRRRESEALCYANGVYLT